MTMLSKLWLVASITNMNKALIDTIQRVFNSRENTTGLSARFNSWLRSQNKPKVVAQLSDAIAREKESKTGIQSCLHTVTLTYKFPNVYSLIIQFFCFSPKMLQGVKNSLLDRQSMPEIYFLDIEQFLILQKMCRYAMTLKKALTDWTNIQGILLLKTLCIFIILLKN